MRGLFGHTHAPDRTQSFAAELMLNLVSPRPLPHLNSLPPVASKQPLAPLEPNSLQTQSPKCSEKSGRRAFSGSHRRSSNLPHCSRKYPPTLFLGPPFATRKSARALGSAKQCSAFHPFPIPLQIPVIPSKPRTIVAAPSPLCVFCPQRHLHLHLPLPSHSLARYQVSPESL